MGHQVLSSIQALNAPNFLLKQAIARADVSPFLGHLVLKADLQARTVDTLRTLVAGDFQRFINLFRNFRLLCAWTIARAVAERYAGDGTANVYGPIARELGCREIPLELRHDLNRNFRQTCASHGLALPPRPADATDLVGDYVAQAGVAHAQLGELAAAFLRSSVALGPPPLEDTAHLYDWSCEAVDRAPHGLIRLRRVIASDTVGYHATIFQALLSGAEARTPFERRFAEAIGAARLWHNEASDRPPLHPPTLIFRDGELGIEVPLRGQSLMVAIAGREQFLAPGVSIGLPVPAPDSIKWRRAADEDEPTAPLSMSIGLSGAILVFNAESGALIQRIQHGAKKVAIEIPEIFVVAEEPFSIDGEDANDLGAVHARFASIDQGCILRIGSRSIQLGLVLRPRLLVNGDVIASALGSSLIVRPAEARVVADPDTLASDLVVRIEHPALPRPIERRPVTGERGTTLSLDGLPEIGSFGALRLSLLLHDRLLSRSRTWFWPGLSRIVEGMVFDAPVPRNLDRDASRHIEVTPSGCIELAAGEDYLEALLGFQCGPDTVVFSFPRKGIVVSVAPANAPERPLPLGSALVVSGNLDGSLIVRSTNRQSGLDICGRPEREAFAHSGARRIPLASLLISDGHDEVLYWPGGDERQAIRIVQIVPSTGPTRFECSSVAERMDFACRFRFAVDAVRLDLTHAENGDKLNIEAAVGRRPVDRADLSLSATQAIADRTDINFRLDRRYFAEGLWFGDVAVRAEGEERWQTVGNERNDGFMFAFKGEAARSLRRDDASSVFLRLNQVLMGCHAPETWPSLERVLIPRWRELGRTLAESEAGRETLLSAAGQAPSASMSPTWVPIHHPLELAPNLFEAAPTKFAVFKELLCDGAEHLARIARLGGCSRTVDVLGLLNVTPLFFTAFRNFARAQRNPTLPLGSFNFDAYLAAIDLDKHDHADQFWSPARLWLTRAHHSWCCDAALSRLRRMAPPGSITNQQRLPGAIAFARRARTFRGARALAAPPGMIDEMDIMTDIPAAISAFARACRFGAAEGFLTNLADAGGTTTSVVCRQMALLLRVAPELFAFYTILWHLVILSDPQ